MKRRWCALLLAVLVCCKIPAAAEEITQPEQMISEVLGSFHMVVLTEGFSGPILAVDGEDYSFSLADDSVAYRVMAYMNGEPVSVADHGDGTFTIRNVTGSLVIGGRKISKLPDEPAPAPQPVQPQPAQEPAPQPAPELPAEEPAVLPEEPVEEVRPEEPKPVEPEPEPEETSSQPAEPKEPIPEVVEEKEPFPWWIPVLAVLGLGMIAAIILLLSRRTVVFAVDGGTAISAQKILKGHTAARPREPEKTGAVFAGWFTDEARTKRWDFENAKVENHMILYAKWLAA